MARATDRTGAAAPGATLDVEQAELLGAEWAA
jgi:hypothetical protein